MFNPTPRGISHSSGCKLFQGCVLYSLQPNTQMTVQLRTTTLQTHCMYLMTV